MDQSMITVLVDVEKRKPSHVISSLRFAFFSGFMGAFVSSIGYIAYSCMMWLVERPNSSPALGQAVGVGMYVLLFGLIFGPLLGLVFGWLPLLFIRAIGLNKPWMDVVLAASIGFLLGVFFHGSGHIGEFNFFISAICATSAALLHKLKKLVAKADAA